MFLFFMVYKCKYMYDIYIYIYTLIHICISINPSKLHGSRWLHRPPRSCHWLLRDFPGCPACLKKSPGCSLGHPSYIRFKSNTCLCHVTAMLTMFSSTSNWFLYIYVYTMLWYHVIPVLLVCVQYLFWHIVSFFEVNLRASQWI